ncbi:MAG: YggT family protein [Eubacteriales bacterium]|nr:YggT family protein [Clostridiales bacterium]MDD7302754.1 YggT family protein [Eubacteriales bacterium]MDY4434503.1 YggT family protein [Candidatus Flemingibacterium sp.]
MTAFIYVVTKLVSVFLGAEQLLMMFRAVLSWLPVDEDSDISNFLFAMTEPVIYPVRMLLDRFEGLDEFPIDLSFIISFMLLSLVQMLLPTFR